MFIFVDLRVSEVSYSQRFALCARRIALGFVRLVPFVDSIPVVHLVFHFDAI